MVDKVLVRKLLRECPMKGKRARRGPQMSQEGMVKAKITAGTMKEGLYTAIYDPIQ